MESLEYDVRHVAKPDDQDQQADIAAPLFAYMIERENIRRRKEAGEPGTWTDDPMLREYSFTNVRRSDDRTTRTLMAQFYGPNVPGALPGDVLFNCCVARFFGLAEIVLHLGWQTAWDAEAAIARVHERQREGKQVFTSAYVITNNGESGDKVEFVCRKVLTRLWNARHRLAEMPMEPDKGWCYLVGQLRTFPALGGTGFMAKEVAQDFILAMGWKPRDLNTFTPVGKGARRGLNRLHGRSTTRSRRRARRPSACSLPKCASCSPCGISSCQPTLSISSFTTSSSACASTTSSIASVRATVSRSADTASEQEGRGHNPGPFSLPS